MRNTALITFVETSCIVNDKGCVSDDCFVGFVFECASTGVVRHYCDIHAHNHVHEGALSHACFSKENDVMLGALE
jgi:hypothetical protein